MRATIIPRALTTLFLIVMIWIAQVLFLHEAAKWGMNGWDDWGLVFYYDAYRGNEPKNFISISNDVPTAYILSEIYYIGPLKQIFGLNQTAFKYFELLLKSLAAFACAFLVFKLTKDKIFSFLTILFFIIFPSTSGVLSHIVLSGGYLTIVFMVISVLYYIESIRKPKKIYLTSLFFFLALAVCPPRAYLILPVPIIIEFIWLIISFKINGLWKPFRKFLKRVLIFYFLPVTLLYLIFLPAQILQNKPVYFKPLEEVANRFEQILSGNLYSLTLPFQMISTLFIDQIILKEILRNNYIVLNFVLFIISAAISLLIKGKKKMLFVLKVMLGTGGCEILFYSLSLLSSNNEKISLEPSLFQASIGGFYVVLGLALCFEWWRYQRGNRLLMLTLAGWVWAFATEVELYITNSWANMLIESNDRYILVCSVGGVIFISGLFTLIVRSLRKINNIKYRLISLFCLTLVIFLIAWKDYKLLDQFYYKWNEGEGGSAYWQNTMYQRFLDKFGRENLKKPVFLFIEHVGEESGFVKGDMGSFGYPISFRIFYDEKGNFIRDNCKAVVVADFKAIEDSYTVYEGEKGFLRESKCVNPNISITEKKIFYPLNSFYAYKMENKQFIDIKEVILKELDYREQP